eukprot:CAMPEP_0170510682 /NCGR_PEP_ID=MMETSP0208-20121228/65897_1 /TAXON_ID=197538 /ORGANISM="Strombidium inclinatum, Strain S3" /LENGTH=268 /DNA_ID=CAMNT_0010794167 /DNA_START=506 /DNA_END=1311 /DNA_ORIENTATION=-
MTSASSRWQIRGTALSTAMSLVTSVIKMPAAIQVLEDDAVRVEVVNGLPDLHNELPRSELSEPFLASLIDVIRQGLIGVDLQAQVEVVLTLEEVLQADHVVVDSNLVHLNDLSHFVDLCQGPVPLRDDLDGHLLLTLLVEALHDFRVGSSVAQELVHAPGILLRRLRAEVVLHGIVTHAYHVLFLGQADHFSWPMNKRAHHRTLMDAPPLGVALEVLKLVEVLYVETAHGLLEELHPVLLDVEGVVEERQHPVRPPSVLLNQGLDAVV